MFYYKIPIDKFDYNMPFLIGNFSLEFAYIKTFDSYTNSDFISITEEEFLNVETEIVSNSTENQQVSIDKSNEIQTESLQAKLLLNQASIIAKQKEQDEALALILLNQAEVRNDSIV